MLAMGRLTIRAAGIYAFDQRWGGAAGIDVRPDCLVLGTPAVRSTKSLQQEDFNISLAVRYIGFAPGR